MAGIGAFAASVETLLMPGKVTRAHVKQEEACTNCHDRTNARTQTSLCLDCHKDIAADVREHQRLSRPHAQRGRRRVPRLPHRAQGPRRRHRAAEPRAVRSSPHRLRARGRARRARLRRLPQAGASPWRKAPATCVDCHKADDVHHGQFTQSCGECHGVASWSGGKFDHDKTEFKLTGAHANVDLRCLPRRRPLQADAEDLHRLPRDGR